MVNIIRPKYVKQDFEKDNIFDKDYQQGVKKHFEDIGTRYSSFLAHYYIKNGGVLDGFRYFNA